MRATVVATAPTLVMTACTTDWLFKGYGIEKKHRTLLGKQLPFKRLVGRRQDMFLPNHPRGVPATFAVPAAERFDHWFSGTPTEFRSARDWLAVEDRRIRPTAYTVSVSGQIMYRTLPYDTFLADARVAECYSRVRPEWKVDGTLWGLAAARICTKAGDIADANFGWRIDDGPVRRAWAFARGVAVRRWQRRFAAPALDDGRPPSSASWPEMGWYAAHSPTLAAFWSSTPTAHRTWMTRLWGDDPWSQPLADWQADPQGLFRIATLLAHWRATGQ